MANEVTSGIGGRIKIGANLIGNITSWTVRKEKKQGEYVSSHSGGWTKRVTGAMDWSGSAEFVGDGDLPDSFPNTELEAGTQVTLLLYADSSESKGFTGPALIESVEITLNVSEEPIGGSMTFNGNGALTQV